MHPFPATAALLVAVGSVHPLPAQPAIGATAVAAVKHLAQGPYGRAYTEAYLAHPVVHASAGGARVFSSVMLNAEGLTLMRGELTGGAHGEGYVDRRHPHAILHEAIVGARFRVASVDASLAGGRGFVPFGSEDPMTRAILSYPANHHLAQVLERLVLIGAARRGPVHVEAALFGGDETLTPRSWPVAERFGDSWAVRGTWMVLPALELQGSHAFVRSPEIRRGGGLDHRMWHGGARWGLVPGGAVAVFAEGMRTIQLDRGRRVSVLHSALVEVDGRVARWRLAARWEQTLRPEETRLRDPFRVPWPPVDLHDDGVTQWRSATLHVAAPEIGAGARRSLALVPFAEVAVARPRQALAGAIFDPRLFYGARAVTTLAAGVRMAAGARHGRMGSYGVAAASPSHQHHSP